MKTGQLAKLIPLRWYLAKGRGNLLDCIPWIIPEGQYGYDNLGPKILGYIPENSLVIYLGETRSGKDSGEWVKVLYKESCGWIRGTLIDAEDGTG